MTRFLIGAIALLSLSGCTAHTVVAPDWGMTYPPVDDEVWNPYPDLGTRRDLAASLAVAHPRVSGAIEYARRAYGYASVQTSVRYLFRDNYEVTVRVTSPQTEVFVCRVNIFTRRVESIQTYNEGWNY